MLPLRFAGVKPWFSAWFPMVPVHLAEVKGLFPAWFPVVPVRFVAVKRWFPAWFPRWGPAWFPMVPRGCTSFIQVRCPTPARRMKKPGDLGKKRFKVIVGCYVLSNPLLVINTAWSFTFGTTFSTERLGQPCGHLVCRQALSMFRNSFLFGVCGCVCVRVPPCLCVRTDAQSLTGASTGTGGTEAELAKLDDQEARSPWGSRL